MKNKIAFFDFDGTITFSDTLVSFIKYARGAGRYYFGLLVNAHYLIAYKLKIISNQRAKEKILQHFFAGMTSKDFRELCTRFSTDSLPALIRPAAAEEIKNLRMSGYEVVLVSASPENWIQHWADQHHLSLIATQLQVQNGLITGSIQGKNCHGAEKVRRIKERYDLSLYASILAFGDTKGDMPMLSLAHKGYLKPFTKAQQIILHHQVNHS